MPGGRASVTIKGDLWRLPAKTEAIHEVLDRQIEIKPNAIEELEVPA
jgi:hypothetical protein